VGENFRVKVLVVPAVSVSGKVKPLVVNNELLMLALEMVVLWVPLFFSCTDWVTLEPTGTVPREIMLGVASSVAAVLTVWACVLPAPIPSIVRSKNPRKTRAPSLFFLDRQTLRGKVSGRPDRKKLQRKPVNGPVSLTTFSGYGYTQVPGYWPEEANAYSLVFPTVARSLTCPFGQGSKC